MRRLGTTGNWTPGKVTLWVYKMQRAFPAQLLGNVAVHRQTDVGELNWNAWCVSSTSTGLLIAMVETEADARRIGQLLYDVANEALAEVNADDVKDRLQKWIYEWIRACRVKRAYVDPTPYRTAPGSTAPGWAPGSTEVARG